MATWLRSRALMPLLLMLGLVAALFAPAPPAKAFTWYTYLQAEVDMSSTCNGYEGTIKNIDPDLPANIGVELYLWGQTGYGNDEEAYRQHIILAPTGADPLNPAPESMKFLSSERWFQVRLVVTQYFSDGNDTVLVDQAWVTPPECPMVSMPVVVKWGKITYKNGRPKVTVTTTGAPWTDLGWKVWNAGLFQPVWKKMRVVSNTTVSYRLLKVPRGRKYCFKLFVAWEDLLHSSQWGYGRYAQPFTPKHCYRRPARP